MVETISVIIPTYNRAAFICRAVESVLDQTFRDFEVIVVDDGSTDNTRQLLEKYRSLPNFQYLYQVNKGRSIARNEGVSHSRGNWIMFLDSDDYLDKNALLTLYNLAKEAKDSVMLYGNFLFFRDNKPAYGHSRMFAGKILNANLFLEMLMSEFWLTKTGSYLIQKEFACTIGGFSEVFEPSEDLEYVIRMFPKAKVSFVSDTVLFVEKHTENTDEMEMQQAIIKICKHYMKRKNEWKQGLSAKEFKKAICALKLRIANGSYELNDHRQSFVYYFGLVKTKPSMLFDRFILKQLFASMLPGKFKKVIKRA
jgi:glycosyltransferase involved in cell wall biosynthesis